MKAAMAPEKQTENGRGSDLDRVRAELERVDRLLVELVAERVRLGRRAAATKTAAGLPIFDPAQEAAVIRRASEWSRDAGLPTEPVRDLFWTLVALTREIQGAG